MKRPTAEILRIWTCANCGSDNAPYRKNCGTCAMWRDKAVQPAKPAKAATGAAVAKGKRKPPAPATKAETEWLAYLQRVFVGAIIRAHGMTFVFPDGDRYTPDAVMWHHGHLTIHEVKAGYRGPGWEQGIERYKRAKAEWNWLDFRLAEKRDGIWYVDGNRMEG